MPNLEVPRLNVASNVAMSHLSTSLFRDRLGSSEYKENTGSMTRRTVTSASAYSRQEISTSGGYTQSSYSSARSSSGQHAVQHAGHYAVSSHVNNGNLVVDNGGGVIQQQTHGMYEENLSKFKGEILKVHKVF